MSTDRALVAARVRTEITAAGTSGLQLSERLGVPYHVMSRRLRGVVPFEADQLMAIARELGVSPAVFVDPDSAKTQQPA
ncbi:hypothetical protein DMP17_21975 [Pseudonocardia sp. TMWB2A]|uniref:helix-turn-helix domain-containing protein n=1 Tax=Pseudonocardia sp. TMWB2A TaxID=687430 RepID=UPI00307E2FE1